VIKFENGNLLSWLKLFKAFVDFRSTDQFYILQSGPKIELSLWLIFILK
jgi:hypothetical protein